MPAPRKSPEDRITRVKPVYKDITLMWDGKTRGPELPIDYDWCEMTKNWWQMIRHSPQAMMFQETDWYFFLETAYIHNSFWGTNKKWDKVQMCWENVPCTPNERSALGAQLKQRIESYGFTWADRRKYGITIVDVESVTDAAELEARIAATPVWNSPVDYEGLMYNSTPD